MKGAVVASVGTTHPWNIAGVGLDARVCARYGIRHTAAVAGVSAQDASGVHALHAVPTPVLEAQLRALPPASVYCIGALPDAAAVRAVAAFLAARSANAAVVDPVFTATLGGELADGAAIDAFRSELIPLPIILLPNRSEAERLLGRTIDFAGAPTAAQELRARGPSAVLLKGGHFEGVLRDILVAGSTTFYEEARLGGSMRGSGGVLAAALACELALGNDLRAAVVAARALVRERIAARIVFDGVQVAF